MTFLRKYSFHLKIGIALVGTILFLIGLLAETLGLDNSPGYNSSEILCLLSGALLILVAVLGSRFKSFYYSTSIIFFNTIILIAFIELFSAAALTLLNSSLFSPGTTKIRDLITYNNQRSYYVEKSWADSYWQEMRTILKKQYRPYIVWGSAPFNGTTITINDKGQRQTPGADSSAAASRVFAFGGSTMWGWGSPDWGTIPAYLQQILPEQTGRPINIENFAESAYVSTQGLVRLLLLLEAGQVPDVVIFYDGVNDLFAARQTGRPQTHQNLSHIASRFNNRKPSLTSLLWTTNTHKLLQRISAALKTADSKKQQDSIVPDPDRLANELIENYLGIYRIVSALAKEYQFDYYFFWQPYILEGKKNLTDEEERLLVDLNWELKMDETLKRLSRATYNKISRITPKYDHMYYLGEIFNNEIESIWIDTWGHVTPEGNELIAREMAKVIHQSSTK